MNREQQRGLIRKLDGRLAGSAVSLATVFVAAIVATPPALGQSLSVLHSFASVPDGASPAYAGLVRDTAGNLYGTTLDGGNSPNCVGGCGAVFKIDATGNETILYSFMGYPTDGAYPYAGLLLDGAGNLYGTTSVGGNSANCPGGCGTVFKINVTGSETLLYSFTGNGDGALPFAGLVRDGAGNLYGTTTGGGTSDLGTVFKVYKTGKEVVLHSFKGMPDGGIPYAGLLRDTAGDLYGTTYEGGNFGRGTVFKLNTSGQETVLYSFLGYPTDGSFPTAGLVQDAENNLYGTTTQGGTANSGTVFKIDATGSERVLYSFTGTDGDGADPIAGLVLDSDGNLYGTTASAGRSSYGTVFKVDPSGTETVLHSFSFSPDGAYPDGGLIPGEKHHFYGTTSSGGSDDFGTVFELTINPGSP